jgi:pachytene checkpoint protein 2
MSHTHGVSYVDEALTISSIRNDLGVAEGWSRIVLPAAIKDRLLNYAISAVTLRKAGLGGLGFPLHGLVLLTGEPGTGKTSLARGLGGELSRVFEDRYGEVRVIDVNAHILPSELLGRTQRNITQLFQEEIPGLAEFGPVVVVIDEIEALAVSRSQASLDINPADVFRGTAALLGALDWISRNVAGALVVGTTNLIGALDDAFVSRADLLLSVPLPTVEVLEQILADTLRELGRRYPSSASLADSPELAEVAKLLEGTDGRQARKFVVDALASLRETALDPGNLTMGVLHQLARQRAGTDGRLTKDLRQ